MDDLKLFAKNDKDLEGLLSTVKQFSNDIGMEFGLDKCAKATFVKGKLIKSSCIIPTLKFLTKYAHVPNPIKTIVITGSVI